MLLRFTLKSKLIGVALVALATTALLRANQWWSWAAGVLAFALVGWALVLGLLRGRRSPFAVGFGVIGLLSLITFSSPTGYTGEDFDLGVGRSPTTALLEFVCPFQAYEDPESYAPGDSADDGTDAADEALFSPDSPTEADPGDEASAAKASKLPPFPTLITVSSDRESPDRFRIEPFVEIGSNLFVLLFSTLGGFAAQAIARRDARLVAADAAGGVTSAETRP